MGIRNIARLVSIVLLLALLLTAVLQNLVITPVQFLGWRLFVPVIVVILVSVFAGFLLGLLLIPLLLRKHPAFVKPAAETPTATKKPGN